MNITAASVFELSCKTSGLRQTRTGQNQNMYMYIPNASVDIMKLLHTGLNTAFFQITSIFTITFVYFWRSNFYEILSQPEQVFKGLSLIEKID